MCTLCCVVVFEREAREFSLSFICIVHLITHEQLYTGTLRGEKKSPHCEKWTSWYSDLVRGVVSVVCSRETTHPRILYNSLSSSNKNTGTAPLLQRSVFKSDFETLRVACAIITFPDEVWFLVTKLW